jgi:hypothetical protein
MQFVVLLYVFFTLLKLSFAIPIFSKLFQIYSLFTLSNAFVYSVNAMRNFFLYSSLFSINYHIPELRSVVAQPTLNAYSYSAIFPLISSIILFAGILS